MSRSNIVNYNVMLQIAVNETLNARTAKFDKKLFEASVDSLLKYSKTHDGFLTALKVNGKPSVPRIKAGRV